AARAGERADRKQTGILRQMRRLHLDKAEKCNPAVLRVPDTDDEGGGGKQDGISRNGQMRRWFAPSLAVIRPHDQPNCRIERSIDQQVFEKTEMAEVESRPAL